MNLTHLKDYAKKAEASNKKLFAKLKKSKPKQLDQVMEQLHDNAFAEIDCLQCANCCKTTSPIFYMKDIERVSKYLRVRTTDFMDKYLHLDKDNDYVLNSAPCPFLGSDNYCSVYDHRPTACREYPHTNRKKVYQVLDLTLKNTAICPAVYQMIEKLKMKF